MLRRFALLFAAVFGAPLACGVGYILVFVTLLYLAIPQLPVWAQGPAAAWLSAAPPESYGGAAGAPPFGGIPDGGYSGPASFLCILPPVAGSLTDRYGVIRPGGWIHYGIDYGTYQQPVEVRTPFGGLVVFAGWGGAFGNLVVVENAGWRVYLAHHSTLLVAPGQLVQAGDVVAMSGSTGNSSGIHVHFEVRLWTGEAWKPVDPNAVLLPGQAGGCDWYGLSAPLP